MKHSIRTRFTLIFTGIMALVLIVMYVINSQFLESYYMRQMVGTLQTAPHPGSRRAVLSNENGREPVLPPGYVPLAQSAVSLSVTPSPRPGGISRGPFQPSAPRRPGIRIANIEIPYVNLWK